MLVAQWSSALAETQYNATRIGRATIKYRPASRVEPRLKGLLVQWLMGWRRMRAVNRQRDGLADPFDTPVLSEDRRIMGAGREIGQI